MKVYFTKAIAHQSGYYLSGNPPRWHKWVKEKTIPSGYHAIVSDPHMVQAVDELK